MKRNYRETLREQLKDDEFRREYEALRHEYELIQAAIDGKIELKLDVLQPQGE
jgi:hypothetical protein